MLNDRGLGEKGRVSHLPATDTQQEANHIGLLLLLNLFHVFEGTHLESTKIQLLALVFSLLLNSSRSWTRFFSSFTQNVVKINLSISNSTGVQHNVPCRRGRSSVVVVVAAEKLREEDLFNEVVCGTLSD